MLRVTELWLNDSGSDGSISVGIGCYVTLNLNTVSTTARTDEVGFALGQQCRDHTSGRVGLSCGGEVQYIDLSVSRRLTGGKAYLAGFPGPAPCRCAPHVVIRIGPFYLLRA